MQAPDPIVVELLRAGRKHCDAGSFDEAAHCVEQALARNPDLPEALALRREVERQRSYRSNSSAAPEISAPSTHQAAEPPKGAAADPAGNDVEGLVIAGIQLGLEGDFQGSLNLLHRAAQLEPGNPSVALGFASTYRLMERPDLTLQWLAKVGPEANSAHILTMRGEALMALGQRQAAIPVLHTALSTPASSPADFLALGNSARLLGDENLAVVWLERGLADLPSNFGLLLSLATAYRKTGRYEDAAETCRKALVVAPRVAALHFEACKLYSTMDQPENAFVHACEGLRLAPHEAIGWAQVGSVVGEYFPRLTSPQSRGNLERLGISVAAEASYCLKRASFLQDRSRAKENSFLTGHFVLHGTTLFDVPLLMDRILAKMSPFQASPAWARARAKLHSAYPAIFSIRSALGSGMFSAEARHEPAGLLATAFGDPSHAIAEFDAALRFRPLNLRVHFHRIDALNGMRFGEPETNEVLALAVSAAQQRCGPAAPPPQAEDFYYAARIQLLDQEPETAIGLLRRANDFPPALACLVGLHVQRSDFSAARVTAARLLDREFELLMRGEWGLLRSPDSTAPELTADSIGAWMRHIAYERENADALQWIVSDEELIRSQRWRRIFGERSGQPDVVVRHYATALRRGRLHASLVRFIEEQRRTTLEKEIVALETMLQATLTSLGLGPPPPKMERERLIDHLATTIQLQWQDAKAPLAETIVYLALKGELSAQDASLLFDYARCKLASVHRPAISGSTVTKAAFSAMLEMLVPAISSSLAAQFVAITGGIVCADALGDLLCAMDSDSAPFPPYQVFCEHYLAHAAKWRPELVKVEPFTA